MTCLLAGVLGAVPADSALAQPANDVCSSAEVVAVDSPVPGSNESATSDVPFSSCSGLDDKDVWYRFSAPAAGSYRFEIIQDFSSTLINPTLALFDACGGTELACDGLDFFIRVDSPLADGQSVLVRIAGDAGEEGTFTLNISPSPAPPVNDECSGATPLMLDTLEAPYNEPSASAGPACVPGRIDLWYSFVAPAPDRYRFSVTGGGFPESLTLYTDCTLTGVLACDDDCDAFGRAELDMAAGQSVIIRVAECFDPGEDNPSVFYVLVDQAPPTPPNDTCDAAAVLAAGSSVPGTTRGATGIEPGQTCFGSDGYQDALGVWYRFTAPAAAESLLYNFTAAPAPDFYPLIRVYDGCNGNILDCGEPFGVDSQASVTLLLAPAQTVYLRIAGTNLGEGDFTLTAGPGVPVAVNDDCAGALPLTPGDSITSTTTNATGIHGAGSPCAPDDEIDLWYTLTNTAASDKLFTLDTVGTTGLSFPTLAAVDVCEGTVFACSYADPDVFPASRISIILDPGETVRIRVAGALRSVGEFMLNVSAPSDPPPIPANDTCEGAIPVSTFPFTEELVAGTALPDADIECDGVDGGSSGGVWYALRPAADCILFIDVPGGSRPELSFALYQGSDCGTFTQVGCDAGSRILFPLAGGEDYRLLVARQSDFTASPTDVYRFTLDCLVEARPGDTCADAGLITLPFRGHFSNADAVNEGPGDAPTGSCNTDAAPEDGLNNSVYFRITPPTGGILHAEFQPFFVEGIAAVYTGACGSLTDLACASFSQPLVIDVPVVAGTSYLIQYGANGVDWPGGDVVFSAEITAPPCIADFNHSGTVSVQDIFDFLAAYFGGDPSADVNGSGSVSVQDIFDFLAAYFGGCP